MVIVVDNPRRIRQSPILSKTKIIWPVELSLGRRGVVVMPFFSVPLFWEMEKWPPFGLSSPLTRCLLFFFFSFFLFIPLCGLCPLLLTSRVWFRASHEHALVAPTMRSGGL